jgi:hypothetical protein
MEDELRATYVLSYSANSTEEYFYGLISTIKGPWYCGDEYKLQQ